MCSAVTERGDNFGRGTSRNRRMVGRQLQRKLGGYAGTAFRGLPNRMHKGAETKRMTPLGTRQGAQSACDIGSAFVI